jgi:hypothetical protein
VIGGISKSIATRLAKELERSASCNGISEATNTAAMRLASMAHDLQSRISTDRDNPWRSDYWDLHQKRFFVKVDSHQLSRTFAKGERYENVKPNTCIFSMNQHADNAACFMLWTLTGYENIDGSSSNDLCFHSRPLEHGGGGSCKGLAGQLGATLA